MSAFGDETDITRTWADDLRLTQSGHRGRRNGPSRNEAEAKVSERNSTTPLGVPTERPTSRCHPINRAASTRATGFGLLCPNRPLRTQLAEAGDCNRLKLALHFGGAFTNIHGLAHCNERGRARADVR